MLVLVLSLVYTQPLQQWLNKHIICFRVCCKQKKKKDDDETGTGLAGKILKLRKKGSSQNKKKVSLSESDGRRESAIHESPYQTRKVEFPNN